MFRTRGLIVCLVILFAVACDIEARRATAITAVTSSHSKQPSSTAQHMFPREAVRVEDVTLLLSVLLELRGGADSSSSGMNIVELLKSTIINALKLVIPKSFWPKSWKKKTGKSSKMMSKEHLEKSFAKGDTSARVQKELRSFMANPPDNCKLVVGSNIRSWVINIVGAEDTIYAGEKYKMKIVFPKDYPSKPPSVYFLKPTPKHVHVYSNGDICLNLLGRDWRPTMTAQTLVLSIMSMLASAKEKKMPQDNAAHADVEPGQQQQGWLYHDEKC